MKQNTFSSPSILEQIIGVFFAQLCLYVTTWSARYACVSLSAVVMYFP